MLETFRRLFLSRTRTSRNRILHLTVTRRSEETLDEFMTRANEELKLAFPTAR